jgi:hypothetical protein
LKNESEKKGKKNMEFLGSPYDIDITKKMLVRAKKIA